MKLIVNADDFGLTDGVNNGVLDCYLSGSLSSATLMVNTEASRAAAEMARANPGLGIGLHFNLTLGRPLSNLQHVPSLVDSKGHFWERKEFEKRMVLSRIKISEVITEFHAQLEAFKRMAIPLTHLDSHQHVHLFPRIFDVLAAYCEKSGIPIRIPWPGIQNRKISPKRRMRLAFLNNLVRRNASKWKKQIRYNKGFASVFDLALSADEITLDSYLDIIGRVQKEPFELMVHPAQPGSSLWKLTRIAGISQAEHEVLSRNNLKDIVRSFGMELVTYKAAFE